MSKSGFPRAGARVVMYHKGLEVKSRMMRMGGGAEVYDGEKVGLMMGAKRAVRFQLNSYR